MSETVDANAPQDAEKPKGKMKLIILVLVVVLLLGGAGGGYYFFFMATPDAEADSEETAKDGKKKKKKKKDEEESDDEEPDDEEDDETSLPDDEMVKHVIELKPFIINLADVDEARYLRLTVSLGVAEAGEEKEPNKLFLTRIKNAMLTVLSTKKSDDVLSLEGKAKLRKELLKAAQNAAEEPEIHAIYITDFIVQL